MIVPGRLTLTLALMTAVLLIAAIVIPSLALVAIGIDVALIVIVEIVGCSLRRVSVTVHPEWPERVQMGRAVDLPFRIENRGTTRVFLKLRQIWPGTLDAPTDTVEIQIDGGEVVSLATPGHSPGSRRDLPINHGIGNPLHRRSCPVPLADSLA